jgi:hypothetical protein
LRSVWPAHAAKHLSALSGASQSNSEKWLSGLSKPSADHLRALLRSERGYEFLSELVAGTDAPWWAAVQIGLRMAELEKRQAEARQVLEEIRRHANFNLVPMDGVAGLRLAR